MRLFLVSIMLVLHHARFGDTASNCDLPTGASAVDNSMWTSWQQTLKSQIQTQDAKDVRAPPSPVVLHPWKALYDNPGLPTVIQTPECELMFYQHPMYNCLIVLSPSCTFWHTK